MLREIGSRLQLAGLHQIDDQRRPADTQIVAITDPRGDPIARFAWKPATARRPDCEPRAAVYRRGARRLRACWSAL